MPHPAGLGPVKFAIAVLACCALALTGVLGMPARSDEPVRIGIVFSDSGTMMASERPLLAATRVAIDEVNRSGGVLGRRLEAVIRDGASNPAEAARHVQRLIEEENVAAVFACWTSACRKAVMRVVEQKHSLLFYPVQYEGTGFGEMPRDPSPHVIYSGAAPNQQIVPAVSWALGQMPRARIFLIGSDYVFPRSANAQIRELATRLGGTVVGERYEPLGTADFSRLQTQLAASRPDVIFNTVNGLDNASLFDALSRADPTGQRYLTISFSVEETQVREIGAGRFVNRYAAWNYFHDAGNPRLADFLPRYREYLGADDAQTSDPVEAAYLQIMIFAEAARRAGSVAPDDVLRAARGLVLQGFTGPVRVDPDNQHLWKHVEIRRFGSHRVFDPVWNSGYPIRPDPAPALTATASVVHPAANEEQATRFLSSDQPAQRLSGLLYFESNNPRELPLAMIGHALRLSSDWSEQVLAARILLTRGGEDAQRIVASALAKQADNNFSLLVLTDVAALVSPDAPPHTLLDAVYEALVTSTDPLVRVASIRALARFPSALSARLAGILTAASAAADPAIAMAAIQAVTAAPSVPASAMEGIGAITRRNDVDRAPQLLPSICVALARIGRDYESDPPAGGSRAFVKLMSALPAAQLQPCADAQKSARLLQDRAFTQWLREHMPNTLEEWLGLLGIVIAGGYFLVQLVKIGVIFLAPAWGIAHLRPFRQTQIPFLKRISSETADFLAVTRRMASRPSAIAAWITHNRAALAACAGPARRSGFAYQPLLIRERTDGNVRDVVPDTAYFQALLASAQCRGEILGEGGVGKTTFASELLRVATASDAAGRPLIGVFLPAASISNPEDFDSLLQSIRLSLGSALRTARNVHATGAIETDEPAFLECLLSQGHLVLVIDDLPRFVNEKWQLSMTSTFAASFGRIFLTGRTHIADLGRFIEPQAIDKPRLSTFVDTYLTGCGHGPLTGAERIDLSDGLDGLFAGRSTVPALFGKLAADDIQRQRQSGGSVADLSLSMPAMVLSFVQQAFDMVPREYLAGLDTRDYWRPVGAMAWACLSTGLRMSPIGRAAALEAVKNYGDAGILLDLICVHTQLGHQVTGDRVLIGSDALGEYLAALWIFDARDPDRWKSVRGRIEELLSAKATRAMSAPAQTFLSALLDVSDRSGSEDRAALELTTAPASAPRAIEAWLASANMGAGEIRVGILHSETGEMAISERPVIAATLLAIERINARGGIGGRKIVPIRKDGASDPGTFAGAAAEMIEQGVACIFGCWTSASRIEVLNVLKETGGLLFYPVQYEGYESDAHALYFGAAPNQQLMPAIEWCVNEKHFRRFMLIGSDYVFPRIANEIMLQDLGRRTPQGVRVLGQPLYVPLHEGWNFSQVLTAIRVDPPDIILNTINGLANLEFFWRLWELKNGDEAERFQNIRVMSFSLGDYEVQRIGAEVVAGHYASWTYFAALEDAANASFLRGMRGRDVFFPSDPAEAAFVSVFAFAEAAGKVLEDGRTLTPESLRKATLGITVRAPSGQFRVDDDNGHVYKTPRIGELSREGFFEVVWSAPSSCKPDPFPYPELREKIQSLRARYHARLTDGRADGESDSS